MKQGKKQLLRSHLQKKPHDRYCRMSLKIPVQNYFCHKFEMKLYGRIYVISVGSVWSELVHPVVVKKGHQYLDGFAAPNCSLHIQDITTKLNPTNKIHTTKCRQLCVSYIFIVSTLNCALDLSVNEFKQVRNHLSSTTNTERVTPIAAKSPLRWRQRTEFRRNESSL